jgi:8-oxo-dGTP diphosphatase
MNSLVHVTVGVIEDSQGRVLIARRPDHVHQGGLWEFPGGKVTEGEGVIAALGRELHEELGIEVRQTQPLITIKHDYGDKQVCLDVHRVTEFQGEAHGKEGQPIKWVTIAELNALEFPAANRGIINAIRLPDKYMITDELATTAEYLETIKCAVRNGVRLIQLRAKHLSDEDYLALAVQVLPLQEQGISILLNTSVELFAQTDAAGLHLNSQRLMQTQCRPVSQSKLLSASVHNERELVQAKQIEVDLLVVSPVLSTASHPDANLLGWERFAELVANANCPVYALGGMTSDAIATVKNLGGQGIAGIRLFDAFS